MSKYISSFYSAQKIPRKSNFTFKSRYSFEKRRSEFERLKEQHPDKNMIICENFKNNKKPNNILKFALNNDISVGQIRFRIRRTIKLSNTESIVLFIDNHIPRSDILLGDLYKKYQDDDGFLYVSYMVEETFG